MDSQKLENLVRQYFRAVDDEDLGGIFQTLSDDCAFTVETHQVYLRGRDQMEAMFRRLWDHHQSVRHDRFSFVTNAEVGLVAVQFRVTNTLKNGEEVFKSNCNFFEVKDGRFCRVNVYMVGENTLNVPGSD